MPAAFPARPRICGVALSLGRRRHRANTLVKALCIAATVIGLLLLASILLTLIWRGFARPER